MKQLIREYFTFNKREKNGIFVLVCIILVLLLCIRFSENFSTHEVVDFSKFEKQLQALNPSKEQKEKSNYIPGKKEFASTNPPVTQAAYFNFDPNQLPESDWKKLGLSNKQIRSIKNYESKGGTFRTKEDIKKMYTISASLYAVLEPYIQIAEKQTTIPAEKLAHTFRTSELKIVEINSADSLQLSTVRGIGPFYAKMIIRYRNLLGGFYTKQQLLEVWKLDKEKYDAIEKYIVVDTSNINKININTCTSKELKHPYINWKTVNGIINYREKHGDFNTINDIKKTDLIDAETFLKLAPYLKLWK
jgi:competence protein ComEA